MKLTALLCFPKHTKTFFSLSAIFTKAPPLGEIFESIPPQSPTLMRGGGGGGGILLIGALELCLHHLLAHQGWIQKKRKEGAELTLCP